MTRRRCTSKFSRRRAAGQTRCTHQDLSRPGVKLYRKILIALTLGADVVQRVRRHPWNAEKIGKDRQRDLGRNLADRDGVAELAQFLLGRVGIHAIGAPLQLRQERVERAVLECRRALHHQLRHGSQPLPHFVEQS